ncbi:MAG: ATP-binding protein [Clostridium sp.]
MNGRLPVVKELLENAIDAKATAVTVEITEGGIAFIRVTDNGCGIARDEIPLRFCRHSTSKIQSCGGSVYRILPGISRRGTFQHRRRCAGGADHQDSSRP